MKSFFLELFLFIAVLVVGSTNSFAQYEWTKYPANPLNIHGSPSSWDESVVSPCVIYNPDLNRYEVWYTAYDGSFPNGGIGFAWSTDGKTWTKHPAPVMLTGTTGWDSLFVGADCVRKEGSTYKMWYTGWKSSTRYPHSIGFATSPDGINWTKYSGNPILSPGTGWESGAVGYPSLIKVDNGYWMFYTGEISVGLALTGRAFSSDGITWQKDYDNNPVLHAGDPGEWDRNNYLPRVIELNNILYIYYPAEDNPGVSGSAIGFATSIDTGKTWTKYSGNPIVSQGTPGSWDNGWIETGEIVFEQNELRLYYDAGGPATGWLGRIGLATSPISNWQIQNSNFPPNVLVVDFSSANSQVCWAVGQVYPGTFSPYPGYIKTVDGGENWILDSIPGIPDGYLQQIFAIDADTAYITVYVESGQSSKGIYKTTDGGLTWNKQTAYNTSLLGPGYIHFFDSQNGVVIGDPNLEAYTTTNGGVTWNPVTMPSTLSDEYTWLGESRITAVGNTVWFSTNYRLFKSTDKGYTWTFLFNEQQYFGWLPSIAFQDNQTGIYALKISGFGTNHIYKKTTDGGTTWSILSNSILDNLAPSCIQYIPGTNSVYVAVGGRTPTMRGTAVTYDAGESWTLIDTVGVFLINFVNDQFGWGSQYATNIVYKYVGPRIINSVEEEVIDLIPTGYSLSQNYPNPFNPSTTFKYSIPTQSKVVIKVYDILGNEIATLIDEEKSVGTYELTWSAANLPSGVYFYQLKAGELIQTKKMILLK